jgi:hypothetical protein
MKNPLQPLGGDQSGLLDALGFGWKVQLLAKIFPDGSGEFVEAEAHALVVLEEVLQEETRLGGTLATVHLQSKRVWAD